MVSSNKFCFRKKKKFLPLGSNPGGRATSLKILLISSWTGGLGVVDSLKPAQKIRLCLKSILFSEQLLQLFLKNWLTGLRVYTVPQFFMLYAYH
jgi:hypothetical protein